MGLKFLNPMKGFLFVNIGNLLIKNPKYYSFFFLCIQSLYLVYFENDSSFSFTLNGFNYNNKILAF